MNYEQEIFFNGPSGKLEGKYFESSSPDKPSALLLHPHPLQGGTMNNDIIHRVFNTLADLDISSLRFNFRSVGKSEGVFDHGKGEVIDSATALDLFATRNGTANSIIVIGYSFGAYIALQLVMISRLRAEFLYQKYHKMICNVEDVEEPNLDLVDMLLIVLGLIAVEILHGAMPILCAHKY